MLIQGQTNRWVLGVDDAKKSPTDFATAAELKGSGESPGILGMSDAAPDSQDFDAAIDAAKAEGNLSRANVARKAARTSLQGP